MKRLATTLLLAAALALIPPQGKSQSAPPDPKPDAVVVFVICGVVVVVIVGYVVVRGVIRMCDNINSNQNWKLTNALNGPLIQSGSGVSDAGQVSPPVLWLNSTNLGIRFESTVNLGATWVQDYEVRMSLAGNVLQGTAYRDNLPVLTNYAIVDTNGIAKLDFTALLPNLEAMTPNRFFRLAQ